MVHKVSGSYNLAAALRRFVVAAVAVIVATLAIGGVAQANPKYAGIVIDAKTGKVLYSENADSLRYPASLTKMMTLYMVFEALEAGRISLNSKVPFSEEDRIHQPISPYAATKAAGELLCHTYSHLFGFRTVCLRFFTVYGARQRPDLAIHKFSKQIWEGQPIQVFGDGTSRRDYTYIDDVIQGVRSAMDYDGSMHEVFNLGESETTELNRLIELIEESLGKKAVIDRQPIQPGDVPVTFADISKARRLLNYNPTTKIEQGIPKFVEWFEAANQLQTA